MREDVARSVQKEMDRIGEWYVRHTTAMQRAYRQSTRSGNTHPVKATMAALSVSKAILPFRASLEILSITFD